MSDWNIYRLGKAAASTTANGQITQYGLAMDLATAQWQNSDQFNTAIRDFAQQKAKQQIASSQQLSNALADERALAASYQRFGVALNAKDYQRLQQQGQSDNVGSNPGFGEMLKQAPGDIMAAAGLVKGAARTLLTPHDLLPGVGFDVLHLGSDPGSDSAQDPYKAYKNAGGLLDRAEFEGYDEGTQQFLINHLNSTHTLGDVLNAPGIKHLMAGINASYRALETPFILGSMRQHDTLPGMDPNWFDPGKWAQAWRESQDQSLGNAMVNSVIEPYVGSERVADWRKNSSLYQLTSLGAEVGATWYADPAVVAGKVGGTAARLSRGELPLRETGSVYKATKQALQRESIDVRGPAKIAGKLRAGQIENNWAKLRDYAQTRPYNEFADLPMFRKRDLDGQSAASALYYAYRESPEGPSQDILKLVSDEDRTYNSLDELTQQLVMGDPKAYKQLSAMKQATPEELTKFAPGAQTYIDAIEATKTKIPQLQKEADELAQAKTLSPFHEWSVHTEVDQRYRDILDADEQLAKYQGYTDWLQNASREPEVNRVHARHFFLDGPYGKPHILQKVTKPIWIQKANVMPMHDVDMGAESIRRQFLQFEHLMGYKNQEGLDQALHEWQNAPTAFDRYQVAMKVEQQHLIDAAAQKFQADPQVILAIYQKVVDEQNKVFQGILKGNQSVYSTAPDLANRLREGQNINLVSYDPDSEMVTLELMDGGKRVTTRVHESALSEKTRPVDPTQTPNYYQPIDTRQFYLELKRNQEIVKDMSTARAAGAAIADLVDAAGTRFNLLWKPLQLFRFGWPQRVLMDENTRAMAILGIPAFTRYYGEAYGKAGANLATKLPRKALDYFQKKSINGFNDLVDMSISNPRLAAKYGRERMALGPGPVVDSITREADPVVHDTELSAAPRVPESWLPVVDKKRLERVNGHVSVWGDYQRQLMKHRAWRQYFQSGKFDDAMNRVRDDGRALSHVGQEAHRQGVRASVGVPMRPWHPLPKIIRHAESQMSHKDLGQLLDENAVMVYDPITAKPIKSGHIVPINSTGTKIPDDWDKPDGTGLEGWYEKHRELLASRGHRIVVSPDGTIRVGRLFGARERRRAHKFQQFVEGDMWDLAKGTHYVVRDANDLSPATEAAYRQFVATKEMVATQGETPYGGPKRLEHGQVYHGTYNELPLDESGEVALSPRSDAPIASGRMVGEGFYTTTSKDIAEGYGGDLYTLKGARDGKTYKVFDLDKAPSKTELTRFLRWVNKQDTTYESPAFEGQIIDAADGLKNTVKQMQEGDTSMMWNVTREGNTWLDLMATLEAFGQHTQGLLTRYLEEIHGAGALHHTGGLVTGRDPHHVYVWLHPEDLLVKPAYAPAENYTPFMKWLSHPSSQEIPIPENRIVRMGVQNPMIRDLRTLHAQIEARRAELKSARKSFIGDPDARRMVTREQELMDALGLEYRRNVPEDGIIRDGEKLYVTGGVRPTALPDTYVVKDPGRFQRTLEQAHQENAARDAASVANGDLRAQELSTINLGHADLGDFDFKLDSIHDRVLRGVLKERETGKGYVHIKSSDGHFVTVPSAYEGHDGELLRGLVSSQGAIEQLSDGHGAALSLFRRNAVGHRAYNPPANQVLRKGSKEHNEAVEYFQKWSDLLNTQIAHSPIWNKMLNGWSDAKIVDWLDHTPEGAAVKREVMHEDRTTELWVNEHRAKLDYYLPSKKHQRLLGRGRIEPSQLRREIHPDERPSVFGPDVEFLDKRAGAGRVLSWMMDRMWHALGTAPIDAFSRHPFAQAMHDLKMRSLIGTTKAEWLDGETLARYERQARNYARQQVRRHLWDLTDSTNFTDALRFMAPFWGAQQEALTKWLRITADRPETVARAFNLQRAVYNNYAVIDQDGQPVDGRGYFSYHPSDRVVMRIPSIMRHTPLGKALETVGTIGVPLGSANTVLQGEEPLLPGPGPLVTIPADKFLRTVSKTYGTEWDQNAVYRWLFPIGRPQHGGIKGVLDQLLPGWGKRVMQGTDQDGVAYANLYTTVANELNLRAQRTHQPAPTPGQIEKQVKFMWGLRTLTGMLSPVQVQYRPQHQFLIDAYHKYEQQYGVDSFDKFIQDYGESVARYAASSSNSPVGIPPTSQGMEDWAQNASLIEQYPKWGSAIISPNAYKDDFNSDAYYAQFELNLGPGDTTPLRQPQSTKERFASADAKAGWYEFRKVDAMLDAQLAQRGLHSINQVGAEDLLAMKQNFVADLSKRLPAWREEYDNYNNDIYARVGELEKWAFRPEFDQRPDIQGVRQYLIIRDQVAHELDRYAATTGGSRSLQAQENAGLRNWFYDQVGQLAEANPAFAEFYSRYLSSDSLEQGSGQ